MPAPAITLLPLQKLCRCGAVVVALASLSAGTALAQGATPYPVPQGNTDPIRAQSPYVPGSSSYPVDAFDTVVYNEDPGNRATLRSRPGSEQPRVDYQAQATPVARYPAARQSIGGNQPVYMPAPETAPTTPLVYASPYPPPPVAPVAPVLTQQPVPLSAPSSSIDLSVQPLRPMPMPSAPMAPPSAPMAETMPPPPPIPAGVPVAISDSPAIVTTTAPEPAPTTPETPDAQPAVRLFDATASGSAPTFDNMDSTTAPAPDQLSAQSQAILSKLPGDLFPREHLIRGDFDISRTHTTQELPPVDGNAADNAIGAGVAVKRLDLDVSYELEKAYNALLQGNTEVAVMVYETILQTAPNNKDALFGLATTLHRLGQLDEARPIYGRLLTLDPYDKQTLNNFLALVAEEAPESAIVYLEQLKSRNPDFSPVYAQLAQLYSQQGRHQEAVQNMRNAVALSPDNLVYKYNLAVLFDENGDSTDAQRIYRQLLRAGLEGKELPASLNDIQKRLTFLSSNKAS